MEYLNLDYHIKRLLLIAVAKFKTQDEQAKALGISRATLKRYCIRYDLNYKQIKCNGNNRITE